MQSTTANPPLNPARNEIVTGATLFSAADYTISKGDRPFVHALKGNE